MVCGFRSPAVTGLNFIALSLNKHLKCSSIWWCLILRKALLICRRANISLGITWVQETERGTKYTSYLNFHFKN